MMRNDDTSKPTPEEQQALERFAKQHPGSTILKDERTAMYLERERLRERGQTPAKWSDIEARAKQEEEWKYGSADWTQFDDVARDWPDLTKPPVKRSSKGLWDALQEWINLKDSQIERFSERYPRFLPPWFYPRLVRDSKEYNDANAKAPNKSEWPWQVWQAVLRQAWYSRFHSESVAQLVNIPTVLPGNTRFELQPVCDAQRAVLAMMLESWRARFCPKCGLPFVARKPADKYWPKECFATHRREKQRASIRYRRSKRAKSLRRKR